MSLLAIGLAAAVAGGILLIAFGLAMAVSPRQGDLLEARLAQFAEAGRAPATLAEVEMSLPLFDRVVRPFLDKIGHRLNRNAGAGQHRRPAGEAESRGTSMGTHRVRIPRAPPALHAAVHRASVSRSRSSAR